MYRYETHLHTAEVSRCATAPAREQVRFYKKLGYTGIWVTDHFLNGNTTVPRTGMSWKDRVDMFCSGYEEALDEGKKLGIDVFFGFEVSCFGIDFLTYGLDKQWLYDHEDVDLMEITDYLDLARKEGGFIVHAHPFREADYIPYFRLMPRQVDAVETINASRKDFENDRAIEYAKAYELPGTAGSDDHHSWQKRLAGVETEVKLNGSADYAKAVLDGTINIFTLFPEKDA